MTHKIPAYPEIRFNETFKTIGSESYQAAFERIEEAIVRLESTSLDSLEDVDVLQNAFVIYEKALDEVETLRAFVRLKQAEDTSNEQTAEAAEAINEIGQRLFSASSPLVEFLEAKILKDECPDELMRVQHAIGLLHHSWMRRLDAPMRDFIQKMRVTCFWPLTTSYERVLKQISVEIKTEENLVRRLSFAQCMVALRSHTSRDVRKQIYDGLNQKLAPLASQFADILNILQGIRILYWDKGGSDCHKMPFEHSNVSPEAWDAMRRVMLRRIDEIRETVQRRAVYYGPRGMKPFDLPASYPGESGQRITSLQALSHATMSAQFMGDSFNHFVKQLVNNGGIEMRVSSSRSGDAFTVPLGTFHTVRVVCPFANDMETALILANKLGEAYVGHILKDKPRFEREVSSIVLAMAGAFHETMARRTWRRHVGQEGEEMVKWQAWRTISSNLLGNAVRADFEMRFIEERQKGLVNVKTIKALLTEAWERWYGHTVQDPDLSLWMTQRHFYDAYVFMQTPARAMGFLLSYYLVHFYHRNPTTFAKDYEAMLGDAGNMDVDALFKKHMHIDLKDEKVWEQALDECLRTALSDENALDPTKP